MNSKTQSDSNYPNSYSESLSPFIVSSKPVSKIEKVRELRTGRNVKNVKSGQSNFSAQLLERDIVNEIQEVEKVIDEIYKLLPAPKFKTQKVDIEDLRGMEESIRSKNISIKNIEEQIKLLKSGIFYDAKKNMDNYPKLNYEIKGAKQNLIKSKNQLIEKKKEAMEKHQSIRAIEEQFKQKCRKERIECITFEQFKQIEMKKRKQSKKVQKVKKVTSAKRLFNQISSMKEIPEKDLIGDYRNPENNQTNLHHDSKKMKDLMKARSIAEDALRTAKKRHVLEINDLTGKLEFLKDQYQQLQAKYVLKNHQFELANIKFSESRSNSERNFIHKVYKTDRNI